MEVITTLKKGIGICVNAFDRARNLLSDSDIVLEVNSTQKTHDFFAEPSERASTGVRGVVAPVVLESVFGSNGEEIVGTDNEAKCPRRISRASETDIWTESVLQNHRTPG